MEPTIEQILMMSGDASIAAPAPAPAPARPAANSRPTAASRQFALAPAPAPRWRNPLPADFLVLPSVVVSLAGAAATPSDALAEQLRADEQLAEMLQGEWGAAIRAGHYFCVRSRLPAPTPPPFSPSPCAADELFISELAEDPELRAYLAENPALAAQFGMAASAASRPGANPMRSLSSTYPQRSSSYSGAVSGPASARAANAGPTLRETLASMGSSLRKRFDTLSARFKRSQTGAAKAPPAASSGTFLGGLFDARGGQYSQLPVADGPLNPVRREAFVDFSAEERDDVEIELMGGGGGGGSAQAAGDAGAAAVPARSASAAWAAADAPPTTAASAWAASLNSGSSHAINAPGVVSTNPVFAIGEEEDEDERTSLTSPKNRHI